jgi:predicted  nucleic acid-binding Zn-ribbon protein
VASGSARGSEVEKVYKLLDYLTIDQAVQWLRAITQTKLTGNDLLDLCESRQCLVYMNVDGINGWDIDAVGNHEVSGCGIQKVLKPRALKYAGTETTLDIIFEGPVFLESEPGDEAYWTMWEGRTLLTERYALFQPADIQALGAKINGGDQPQDSDLERLRHLCHREQTARRDAEYEGYVAKHHLKEALSAVAHIRQQLDQVTLSSQDLQCRAHEAEIELKKLRQESGSSGLNDIREMLKAKNELDTLTARAEAAESMVGTLDSQLRDLADKKRLDDEAFKVLTTELRKLHQERKNVELAVIEENGLNFPYSTKELEVMRQVALKYWAQYTPEMRQPKQGTIQREFCSLLGLNVPAEKTPPHKAIYLATAIKPDDLPEA